MPHLYFTDIVSFTLTLSISASGAGGDGLNEIYEVSMEPIVNIIYRPASLISAGSDISQGLSDFNLTINTANTGRQSTAASLFLLFSFISRGHLLGERVGTEYPYLLKAWERRSHVSREK